MDDNSDKTTSPKLLEASNSASLEEVTNTATKVRNGLVSAIQQTSEIIISLADIKVDGISNIEEKVQAIGNALSVLAVAKKEYCNITFQPNSLLELQHMQKVIREEKPLRDAIDWDDSED